MKRIKLIASDIDGTLIKDSTPDLYPEMVTAIGKLMEQGILFCAASGRQYQSMRNVFREVSGDLVYIAENGAQIRYQGHDILITPMKRKHVEGIVTNLRQYYDTCDIIVSTPEGSLIESRNQDFIDLITFGYHNRFRVVKDVLEEDVRIIKIAIYQKGGIRELGERTLIPMWKNRVKACMAGEDWVDFMDASVDKGNALQFIQDYFRIEREETMAFGDNNNDIGMLEAAGESYAVANAREEVRAAAGNICPPYTEKGVYQVIKGLIAG